MPKGLARFPLYLGGATLLYLLLRLLSGGGSNGDRQLATSGRTQQEALQSGNGYGDWNTSDKTIVVATMTKYDTSWVQEQLPDWQHAVYMVDDHDAPFHTAVNKGHEANVYLTWIIDNYENLPEIAAFTHHHEKSWHIDNIFVSNPDSVKRLNLETVRRVGYQSFACGIDYVCHIDRFTRYWSHFDAQMAEAWPFLFPGVEVPNILLGPCCAQFAVTKAAILARPKADYVRMRRWVENTEMADFYSGRIFEYAWHVIFGKPAYFCTGKDKCACEAFDICDLKAHWQEIGVNKDPEVERNKQAENWRQHDEWQKKQRVATSGHLAASYKKDQEVMLRQEEKFKKIFDEAQARARREGYSHLRAGEEVGWRDHPFQG